MVMINGDDNDDNDDERFNVNAMTDDPKKGKRALHSLECGCTSATY